MKLSLQPIKALFGRVAAIDDWQFIADASREVVVDCLGPEGQFVERRTLSIGTTRVTASELLPADNLNRHSWWRIVSISGGTVYGLPARPTGHGSGPVVITAASGWVLSANDQIGFAPNRGTYIQSLSPSFTSLRNTYGADATVDGSNNLLVRATNYEYTVAHVTSTTSLAGIWEGTQDDLDATTEASADWYPIPVASLRSEVLYHQPGDTVTPNDDDLMHVQHIGSMWVRYRRTAGSGTIRTALGVAPSIEQARSASPKQIKSSGVLELIGINEQVDQNEYCQEVEQAFGRTISGEILNITLINTEDGSGAVLRPEGTLFGLTSDPNVANGATTMGAANFPNVVCQVEIDSSMWSTNDTGGAVASKAVAFAFESISSIFWLFQLKSATSFNDAAGDDEQLELVVRYREEA